MRDLDVTATPTRIVACEGDGILWFSFRVTHLVGIRVGCSGWMECVMGEGGKGGREGARRDGGEGHLAGGGWREGYEEGYKQELANTLSIGSFYIDRSTTSKQKK